MIYHLHRQQQLNCDINTAWDFFSSARNLAEITPKSMNFTVLTNLDDDEIYEGMLIDYHVSPLFGIKLQWQTEIQQVKYHQEFIDIQNKGPFTLWKHHHQFIPNENGVMMVDTVEYKLPLGFLGNVAHRFMVQKKLQEIFNYRFDVLNKKFNNN